MSHPIAPLGPGDKAPDFDLPAADRDGRIALGDYLRRGPVLLSLLLGLYCPFCRRRISQLKPTCDALREARIELVGVVIASVERARRYFEFAVRPCFPIAAVPDRSLHRAYGLTSFDRSPEYVAENQRLAAEALREMGIETETEKVGWAFTLAGGYEWTAEDDAEWKRPLQTAGAFLIDSDGVIRWVKTGLRVVDLPRADELLTYL